MNKPYIVEIDPEWADKITFQVLEETLEAVKANPHLWGKGAKKDAKALKRVIRLYSPCFSASE